MNLSKWVDLQLQPFVKKLKSYLKDDNNFLRKINDINQKYQLPKNALLAWDVKPLFASVPYKDGLEALKKTLEENVDKNKATTMLLLSLPPTTLNLLAILIYNNLVQQWEPKWLIQKLALLTDLPYAYEEYAPTRLSSKSALKKCRLSSRKFFQGGKIYSYANFFCYANFSIVFGPNFGGAEVCEGGNCPRGGPNPL